MLPVARPDKTDFLKTVYKKIQYAKDTYLQILAIALQGLPYFTPILSMQARLAARNTYCLSLHFGISNNRLAILS